MDILILLLILASIILALTVYFFLDIVYNVKLSDLTGKHVVVTGGSSGIGKSVAVEAAKLGAHVTIIARNEEKLNSVKQLVTESCVDATAQKITALSMDVTQSFDVTEKKLIELEDAVGPVFMLVNCAGSCECATLENASESNFRYMMDLNLMGTVLPTKVLAQRMASRQKGIIVVTASQAALLGIFGMGAYCASKWALRGFAETLRHEMAPHNVSVTLCLPPDTDTPGFENENKDKPEETKLICQSGGLFSPDQVAKKLLSDALKGRFWSTIGCEGVLLTFGCAGFSPLSSVPEVFAQVVLAGLVRVVSVFHLRNMTDIIACAHLKRKEAQNIKKLE